MKFKIDDDIFLLTFDHEIEFNEVYEWLKRIELE
jgi:3'-phosphoadenosine 5'-phosphosulfate sulfotransferase (PAPS reductase)/FAD synthetase